MNCYIITNAFLLKAMAIPIIFRWKIFCTLKKAAVFWKSIQIRKSIPPIAKLKRHTMNFRCFQMLLYAYSIRILLISIILPDILPKQSALIILKWIFQSHTGMICLKISIPDFHRRSLPCNRKTGRNMPCFLPTLY